MTEFRSWRYLAGAVLIVGDLTALVVLPLAVVVVGLVFGAVIGVYAQTSLLRGTGTDSAGSTRRSVAGGSILLAALAGVAVIGILDQFGAAGILVLLVVAATSPMVLGRLAKLPGVTMHRSGNETAAAEQIRPPVDVQVDTDPSSLSDTELCRRWRCTYSTLQRAESAQAWAQVVDTRTSLLAELERRDPAGFARWMASGARAAGDPQRYLFITGTPGSRNRQPPDRAA